MINMCSELRENFVNLLILKNPPHAQTIGMMMMRIVTTALFPFPVPFSPKNKFYKKNVFYKDARR